MSRLPSFDLEGRAREVFARHSSQVIRETTDAPYNLCAADLLSFKGFTYAFREIFNATGPVPSLRDLETMFDHAEGKNLVAMKGRIGLTAFGARGGSLDPLTRASG